MNAAPIMQIDSSRGRQRIMREDSVKDGIIIQRRATFPMATVERERHSTGRVTLIGVQLELDSLHVRLSRSETRGRPLSALGEFLWHLIPLPTALQQHASAPEASSSNLRSYTSASEST